MPDREDAQDALAKADRRVKPTPLTDQGDRLGLGPVPDAVGSEFEADLDASFNAKERRRRLFMSVKFPEGSDTRNRLLGVLG